MRFSPRLIPGVLIQRYKRFLADVRLGNGHIVTAHCTNTGNLMGCKEPGSRVYLSRQNRPGRRLPYTWEIIRVGPTLVGVNTLCANRLALEGIQQGVIAELQGYPFIRPEVRIGPGTRLDLVLEGPAGRCFAEVKNVTWVSKCTAAFPDAVSERGTKHLKELIRLRRQGFRAALVFIIQRDDCRALRPADEIDREYGLWLRKALRAGVEILPYYARVSSREILLTRRIPLEL